MPYYALDYLPYQYLRKARRGRSGRSAVLGQAVKSAGIRNGNVALFSKIRLCGKDDSFMICTVTTRGLRNDDAVNHCSVKDFRNTIRV